MILIDTPWNTQRAVAGLVAGGIAGVIRYYNHRNSGVLPEKRLKEAEASAISAGGLVLCTVFQQRQNQIADFTEESGVAAGKAALEQAETIGQPAKSAIYLSVDADFRSEAELERVGTFFTGFAKGLRGERRKTPYRIGAYGSGRVLRFLKESGRAEYLWLAFPARWAERQELLDSGAWHIFQHAVGKRIADLDVDLNQVNSEDFGQFTLPLVDPAPGLEAMRAMLPEQEVEAILAEDVVGQFRVQMRGGAELRAGPGTDFPIVGTLAAGEIVRGVTPVGDWMLVDAKGDGLVDGYCLRDLLSEV